MRSPRTFAALAFALLGLAVGVPSASAIDPFPIDGNVTLSNANFTVHYNGGASPCDDKITEENAGTILGMLDRARSFYAGMGWPAQPRASRFRSTISRPTAAHPLATRAQRGSPRP